MRRGVEKNRKGLSEMIGYILLISMTIILSLTVYGWLKTYVPTKSIECADGASLFMQDFNYTCNTNTLNLTLKNNGRFDLAGYFIHATTNASQELAVTDISGSTPKGSGGVVTYWQGGTQDYNPINAGSIMKDGFLLSSIGQIYSIEVVPMRYELINNRNRPVSCSNAKIVEKLSCTIPSTCGNNTIESPEVCDGSSLGSKTCLTQGFAGGNLSCKSTCLGFDASQCLIQVCGDGILQGNEMCDQGSNNVANGDGCSSTCQVEFGWSCINNPLPSICNKNSTSLFYDGFDYGPANPLSNGWTSICTGGCGGTDVSDIYTSITDPTTNLHNSYYMVTKDTRAAIRTINATSYGSINLNYWRTSNSLPSSRNIMVDWRIDSSATWTNLETTLNPGTTWTQKNFVLPSSANNQSGIQIRFYTDGGNNQYALWDDVNLSAKVL